MLLVAFYLLLIAAVFGGVIAALGHRSEAPPLGLTYGILHGSLGAAGLAALVMALRGPPRGAAMGVGSFGSIAAVLLAITLLAGLIMFVVRSCARRVPSLVIGLHATIAISGIVILAAYALVG